MRVRLKIVIRAAHARGFTGPLAERLDTALH
jgi:hypothetical protein